MVNFNILRYSLFRCSMAELLVKQVTHMMNRRIDYKLTQTDKVQFCVAHFARFTLYKGYCLNFCVALITRRHLLESSTLITLLQRVIE